MDRKIPTNNKREQEWILQEKYHGEKTPAFYDDIARLENGEPLAYIIGNLSFLGCTIDLSYKPLIPRTETEYWLEIVINRLSETHGNDAHLLMLDIFSGSGCIGVALLRHLHNSEVHFGEREPDLLTQIQHNVDINKLSNRSYNIYQSNVFESLPKKKYDYIFANPPYLSRDRLSAVQGSVLSFEPHVALFAEEDGFSYIKQTIQEGVTHLSSAGIIYIEIEPHHNDNIIDLCVSLGLHVHFIQDQFKQIRLACISRQPISNHA